MSIRGMMVAVAIACLLLASGAWLLRRRHTFHAQALHHKAKADRLIEAIGLRLRAKPGQPLETPEMGRIRYHLGLALKYAKAHNRPWLPVEPDPPEPE